MRAWTTWGTSGRTGAAAAARDPRRPRPSERAEASGSRGPDAAVADRAAMQRGLVTRADLAAAGVSADGVYRRVKAGRLHRIHPGVYAVGHRALPPLAPSRPRCSPVGRVPS